MAQEKKADAYVHLARRLRTIAEARSDNFLTLVKLAQLDPKSDFVGADLREMDFSDLDLRQFDFTGADFRGSKLTCTVLRADAIRDAMFDATALPIIIKTGADRHPSEVEAFLRNYKATRRSFDRIISLIRLVNDSTDVAFLRDVFGLAHQSEQSVVAQRFLKRLSAIDLNHSKSVVMPQVLDAAFKSTHHLNRHQLIQVLGEDVHNRFIAEHLRHLRTKSRSHFIQSAIDSVLPQKAKG